MTLTVSPLWAAFTAAAMVEYCWLAPTVNVLIFELHISFWNHCLTNPYLPKVIPGLLLQRSRPRLLTAAAWSGLGPAPEADPEGPPLISRAACPHGPSVHGELLS